MISVLRSRLPGGRATAPSPPRQGQWGLREYRSAFRDGRRAMQQPIDFPSLKSQNCQNDLGKVSPLAPCQTGNMVTLHQQGVCATPAVLTKDAVANRPLDFPHSPNCAVGMMR
jgi:hypothetical protein